MEIDSSPQGTKQARRLKPAEALIYQIIFRQAGTLAKALLEGVMNSADALAKSIEAGEVESGEAFIDIHLSNTEFQISDNGKGFTSDYEIDEFFETFGTEHELDHNGISQDAKFGTFRIGRGQLFAFAATQWRSGKFLMEVDVKNRGLDWTLTKDLSKSKGCVIDGQLYEPLGAPDLRDTLRTLTRFVGWVNVPVKLNGEVVSRDPAKHSDWNEVTDDYYLQWEKISESSGIEVYQQGVYVMQTYHAIYGVSALVVTKKALKLNTARNDVLDSCPVWKAIKRRLHALGDTEIRVKAEKVRYLSPEDRLAVMEKIATGSLCADECGSLPLFEDTTGETWSPNQLKLRCARNSAWAKLGDGKHGVIFAPTFSAKADRTIQHKAATVLSEDVLTLLKAKDAAHALQLIGEMTSAGGWLHMVRPCEFEEAMSGLDEAYKIIQPDKWTKRESLIVQSVTAVSWSITNGFKHQLESGRVTARNIGIGTSSLVDAWTDGKTHITITRSFLKAPRHDEAFFHNLASLVLHEYCHNEASNCDHGHPPAFYRHFHDVVRYHGSDIGYGMYCHYVRELNRVRWKLPKKVSADVREKADAAFNSCLLAQLDADERAAASAK